MLSLSHPCLQEIEDHMIDQYEYEPNNPDEEAIVKQLTCSSLLNMALAFQKLNQWPDWLI
jgi:hypothetical protein